MDVNVTPTSNTPGVSTHAREGGYHHHDHNALQFPTYLVGKSGEDTRELIREIVGNTKDVMSAVERNHGETRALILENKLAIAMVNKDVEINSLRTHQEIRGLRNESLQDQISDLKAQLAKAA